MSNPWDTSRLAIDEEAREICNALKHNKSYDIKLSLATRADELNSILLENEPSFLHFAVHGGGDGIILGDDNYDRTIWIDKIALKELISIFPSVKFVFIGTCYSFEMAYILSEYVPYVIGIHDKISDKKAIIFAKNFYKTLSLKKDIEFSFDFAVKSCNLFYNPLEGRPVLFKKEEFQKITPELMSKISPELIDIAVKTGKSIASLVLNFI